MIGWAASDSDSWTPPRVTFWVPFLSLRNPGFGNRKPWVFINRHPPFPPPNTPFKIPKDPPLLVWECIGVHSSMGRSAGASFGGRDGVFSGRVRVAIDETRGFLTCGFAISDLELFWGSEFFRWWYWSQPNMGIHKCLLGSPAPLSILDRAFQKSWHGRALGKEHECGETRSPFRKGKGT